MVKSKKAYPILVFNPRGKVILFDNVTVTLPNGLPEDVCMLVLIATYYGFHIDPKNVPDVVVLVFFFNLFQLPDAPETKRKDLVKLLSDSAV